MTASTNYLGANALELILNAVDWATIADDAAASPLTNLYVALHSADPGVGGSQATSEADYPGYARVAIARDGTRWTVSAGVATLVGEVDFPEATDTGTTLTHFSIGTAASGAGNLLLREVLRNSGGSATSLTIADGTIPRVVAGSTITVA